MTIEALDQATLVCTIEGTATSVVLSRGWESTTKRILVTGGAGFLDSHLCERLLNNGHEILCVDNSFHSAQMNITHLLENPNMELMRHDVIFPLYVEVDESFNLACPASPIWPNGRRRKFCRRQHLRFTAIAPCIRRRKSTGQRQSDRPAIVLRSEETVR